jgi:predicted nucleic acid-binding protein
LRIVICDTGPVLHLWEARALDLLGHAGEVIVPPAVEREIEAWVPDWSKVRPMWLRTEPLPRDARAQVEAWAGVGGLGLGEVEAILLARAVSADWLLTDDAGARLVAALFGLEVHGSLGVILWAAAARHIGRQDAAAALERLAATSLWISRAILREARRALDGLAP